MIPTPRLSVVFSAISLAIAFSSGVFADDELGPKPNKAIVEEPASELTKNKAEQKIDETDSNIEKTVNAEPGTDSAEDDADLKTESIITTKPARRNKRHVNRNTRVKVRAPYARVDVDTNRRRVRIRVPYYSGDIRW